jgi:hypothetical protein
MDPIRKVPDAEPRNPAPSSIPEGTGDDEALDWDFQVEVAAPRRSRVVQADVEYVGRAKPIPLSDPADSGAA